MSWGLADVRHRRRGDRGRITKAAFKGLMILGTLGIVGLYGYQVGSGVSEKERASFEREVNRMTGEMAAAAPVRAAQEVRLRQLELALDGATARYRRDVPTAAEVEIVRQARRRIESGVPVARIASIVAAAPPEERCEPALETRCIALATTDSLS
ncbi:MAG: hypothetical protein EXQ88_02470 [Alphaproteobacteria bacterium]|nr:hypothetical protein [Alphaproteobacteria bacterium]